MKKVISILMVLSIMTLSACESKIPSIRTSRSNSKTVNQVLEEQKNASGDKNHGGNVVNPNDTSNKAVSGGVSNIGVGSNLKKEANNQGVTPIDVDLTRLNAIMVYSEVNNMMTTPEDYVGKKVRMRGKLAVYKYPERNYYTCIIADATACCQQGMEFLWAGNHKYPEDYPNEGDEITVTGVFDIYYEGDKKYCQLKDSSLVKS